MNNQNFFSANTQKSVIRQFHNDEFGDLEVLLDDGKPYFPATECAKILGYKNPQKAVRDHCKGVNESFIPSSGGSQRTNFISEGDLYRLIIRSKLPAAVRFETWVFDTVLPSVRKYGGYIMSDKLEEMVTNPEFAAALIEQLQNEKAKNAELEPKAKYYDKLLRCKKTIPISLIAKDYGMSASDFNNLLHDFGVQYKIAGTWLLYQKYAGMGYTQTRTYHYGEDAVALHTCWTQRGRLFIYNYLASYGITPVAEFLDGVEDFWNDGDYGDYEELDNTEDF